MLRSLATTATARAPLVQNTPALASYPLRHTHADARDILRSVLSSELEGIKEAGTFKAERVITSPQNSSVSVAGTDGRVLNFCANNYLGLADHPALIEAAKATADTHGVGMASVRFICGTQDIHKKLEDTLSTFHGTEDTILYPSCFDANAGVFEALFTEQDAIVSDALNHASIIDGMRLCKAKKARFNHMDMDDLDKKLGEAKDARLRLIVTDGAFSMDGDVAPLDKICDLADKHSALVMIDECHATGFMGKTGRGTAEYHGVEDRIDIINSTLGKAMGGASGGYTSGSKEIVSMLRNKSRPYLFSNAVAPPLVAAAIEAYRIVSETTELRDRVEANAKLFRARMEEAGFTLAGKDHPIIPVMLGDAKLASQMADAMLKRGIYVIGFSFPVVPRGEARIRVQLSAGHTTDQVNQAVDAFIEVGKELGVIN